MGSTHRQPGVTSPSPFLTKTLLWLGVRDVPGTSVSLIQPKWGKAAVPSGCAQTSICSQHAI